MTHSLFNSPLFALEHHTPALSEPAAIIQREVRPWDMKRAARMARVLLLHMSGNPPRRSWGMPLQEFIPYYNQRTGDEEAAYWLDLMSTPARLHTLFALDRTEVSEQDMLAISPSEDLAQILSRPALHHALFSPADTVGEYEAEHISHWKRIVAIEMLRPQMPYLDVLTLILERDHIELLERLEAPPVEVRDQALAMVAAPLARYIDAQLSTSARATQNFIDRFKPFDTLAERFPAAQVLDTLMRHRVEAESHAHYFLKPFMLDDPDPVRRSDQVAKHLDYIASRKYKLDAKLLAQILRHEGFTHFESLRAALARPKKAKEWPDYCAILSQFEAPEATVLSALANPLFLDDPEHFTLRSGLASCGGALALLHERGKLREAGAQLLLRRLTIDPEAEHTHLETLLPLCSPSVQKRVKKEFLSAFAEPDATELPRSRWTPWMLALAHQGPVKDVLDEALVPTFEHVSQHVHAGRHHTFLFPRDVLLGIFDAYRRDDLEKLAIFDAPQELFDEVLYKQDVLRVLDALLDVAQREEVVNTSWLESLRHAFDQNHFSVSSWTPEAFAQLHSFDDVAKLPPRHIVKTLLPTLPEDHDTQIDWHAYIEHADLLDARSQYLLDYGAEKITMSIDGQFNASYKTPDGESSSKPPKVSDHHDLARANASRKQARDLITQVRRACKAKYTELRRAMVCQAPWTLAAWRAYLGSHPVYRLIVHTLVWQVYSPDHEFVMNVLPDEDGSFIDQHMNTVHLDQGHLLTLAHPLDLTEETHQRWLEILAEFERIQAFAQLEHTVYAREEPHTNLISLIHTRANKLKKKTLSRSDLCFDRFYTEERALHYTLRRQISGHAMTLDFGTSWDKKMLRELRFDDTPIAIPDALDHLPELYYSELVHFLRERLK